MTDLLTYRRIRDGYHMSNQTDGRWNACVENVSEKTTRKNSRGLRARTSKTASGGIMLTVKPKTAWGGGGVLRRLFDRSALSSNRTPRQFLVSRQNLAREQKQALGSLVSTTPHNRHGRQRRPNPRSWGFDIRTRRDYGAL